MIDLISKEQCTGCEMCGDLCPQAAISFKQEDTGFWYPVINKNKCNGCGLCREKCPVLNSSKAKLNSVLNVYAAWSKNLEVRKESTSGGVFWEIAKWFIENENIVVATRWEIDFRSARFAIANNVEELKLLRGSKYIQSDAAGIYKKVKEFVKKGKKILFCGTPCQIAAMRMYLGEYDKNIYYLDFICRNVNSPKALNEYITDMEKIHNSKVSFLRQKSKKIGWESLATNIVFENGTEVILDKESDLWIKGFIQQDLFTRESCFECQYRSIPRKNSDITIGDFWGCLDVSPYELYRGISVVIVNTEEGRSIINSIRDNLMLIEKEINEVINGNPALLQDPKRNSNRDAFFENVTSNGFIKTIEEILPEIKEVKYTPIEELAKDKIKYKSNGEIDDKLYLYLNFQCKNIVRKGRAKIIPYKNAIFDMKEDSRIVLEGNKDLEVGINALHGSKIETLVRFGRNANIVFHHGGLMFYGTTLEVKDNACFETGFFSANTGSVFVIDKKMLWGEDIMIGRNVMIYDSDFHQILDDSGKPINYPTEVIIEDHVWLTANININKGSHIKAGTVVTNHTVINGEIPEHSLVAGRSNGKVIRDNYHWSRNSVKKYAEEFKKKRIILYGYGIEGEKFCRKFHDRIEYIIDNMKQGNGIVSFDEFKTIAKEQIKNAKDWMCVIAAPNYYDEIYYQVKKIFPDMLLVSSSEI